MANTDPPLLPVEIVLAPDWSHAHAGIDFDQDFFFHPRRRVEAEIDAGLGFILVPIILRIHGNENFGHRDT